ncbi:MAG: two-component regulator propeller domain-containing protein [Prolixibacteraceae bacterium]
MRRTFIFKLFLVSFLLICCSAARAEQFKNITTNDGLSSNMAVDITQDSIGFLWFATEKGLNRYDGYTVTSYFANPKDSNSIANNHINVIHYTSRHILLIGTRKGLSIYNPTLDNFTSYYAHSLTNNSNQSNYINDIVEDRQHNIWIASASGVFKFDQKTHQFSEYFSYKLFFYLAEKDERELKQNGIPNYVIAKLDKLQNLFFMNDQTLLDKLKVLLGEVDHLEYSQSILTLILEKQKPFYASSVNALALDASDNLWLGLSNGHLVQMGTKDKAYRIAYRENNPDIESNIYSMIVQNNELWVGRIKSGMIFDLKSGEIKKNTSANIKTLLNSRDLIFNNSDANFIWAGSASGLLCLNKKEDLLTRFNNTIFDQHSISSDYVKHVFIDRQKQVWIATSGGGVCKIKIFKQFINTGKKTRPTSQSIDNKVSSLMVDSEENTWVGYYAGGIDVYDKTGEIIHSFSESTSKGNIGKGTIIDIVQDKEGTIWIGTYLGGLQYYQANTNKFLEYRFLEDKTNDGHEHHIIQLLCDQNNNLWINTLGKGFYQIAHDRKLQKHFTTTSSNLTSALMTDWVNLLYSTPQGKLVFSIDEFLFQWNEQEKTITSLLSQAKLPDRITCIFEDLNGNLYLGTTAGLILAKVNGKESIDLFDHPLLPDYTIADILQDSHQNLWVSTDNGLFKIVIHPEKYQKTHTAITRRYLTDDGLPAHTFVGGNSFKSTDGKMLFGTDNGFTSFYPDSIKDNTDIPNVVITNFKLFNNTTLPGEFDFLSQHISYTKALVLPHDYNFLSFEFVALNFINSDANQFAYKLEGIDDDWNFVGNKREANYTELPPGSYIFKVKASNNDNIWNEQGSSLAITIKPPFWKTKLAMAIYIVVFFLLLALLIQLIQYQEKYRSELKLERMRMEKDIELNKTKLRFFTNISHEFRTPLTLISGPVESLLKEGKGNNEQLNLIQKNTRKLLSLVDQIMDIRKLNSGKMVLKKADLNVLAFVAAIVADFDYQCQSKKIKLTFKNHISKLQAKLDHNKFETIVSNLLSNAIKYTPEGGEIIVSLDISNPGNITSNNVESKTFTLSVKDTGDGIPPEDVYHVFERFYQSSLKSEGGSGIGLTLVKELTEMHNGSVEVKSKIGIGTEFLVHLPTNFINTDLQYLESIDQNMLRKVDELTNFDKMENQFDETDNALPLILIVEDNHDVRNYIKSELESAYRIITAQNGKSGLEKASSQFPDIIISDIMMPEMDGLELCKHLKSDEKTSHIPIILLTAYNNENTNVAGYETGADSFMVKPFSPMVLRTRIKNILQTRERLKEKFSNILYAIPSNKSLNTIDEQFIKKAIQIVEENLVEEKFSIEFLCKELGYSRTALYSKIKALTDQSISEFIKLIRLKKSIELFQSGQNSINEVAFLVGFKTHSHFSRCFSEEFKMPPTEYLAKLKEEKNRD